MFVNRLACFMKVFLSWSGEPSKTLATVLHEWLATVFPDVTFWLSTRDIDLGKRWGNELDEQLGSTDFGILCLVPTNLLAPWLVFEAGALSKSMDTSRVVPYCLGLQPEHIQGPLSKFQGVSADQGGTYRLVENINSLLESKRPDMMLARTFHKWWPDLQRELEKIPIAPQGASLGILDARLVDFVDCSDHPMYVTDEKLIVRYCNKRLLSFIGARYEQIIGTHVNSVIGFFEKLVPKEKRAAFRRRQAEVVEDAETAPYACISEVVDLSQRSSGKDTRLYRVWIQADFVYAGDKGQAIGSVVIYHPVEITIDSTGKYTLPELQV